MKYLCKSLLICILVGFIPCVFASSDQTQALYEQSRKAIETGDMQAAFNALHSRRELDPQNLRYIYEEGEFILQYASDKTPALDIFNDGVNLAEQNQDHYWKPRFLEMLAGTLFQTGNAEQAYETGIKAVSCFTEQKHDEEFSDICQLLSGICSSLGKQDEALKYGKQALYIRKELLGTSHVKTAATLTALGLIYLNRNEFSKARSVLDESESIYKALNIEDVTLLNNQATLAFAEKNFDAAREFYQRALTVAVKEYGNNDPQLISIYRNLSAVESETHNYDVAFSYLSNALANAEQAFGIHHPAFAALLNDKGLLAARAGQYGQAMDLFSKALKIFDESLGEDSQDSQNILINLYRCACEIVVNDLQDDLIKAKTFMADKYFTLQTDQLQAYLLSYGEWKMNCAVSIFDYIPSLSPQRKEKIVLSYDGKKTSSIDSSALDSFTVSIRRDKNKHDELIKILE